MPDMAAVYRALTPESILPAPIFRDFANDTIELGGVKQAVAFGEVLWKPPMNASSPFWVLPAVVRPDEVDSILALLKGTDLAFDTDPDTVDGMATHEIFVENRASGLGTDGGLKPDSNPAALAARRPLREKLRAIMEPILRERLTPFVRSQYSGPCGRGPGRACTPCYSLVRRYREDERVSHGTHHDGHALVTVVISLSDYGREYHGGLYVGAHRGDKRVLGLRRGDAVVHQSNLLHGVKVEAGERWSWVLWYKDSATCEDHGHEWSAECALQGDAVCQNLHASKVGGTPGLSREETLRAVEMWSLRAAHNGHSGSMYKLGRAFLHKLPSTLPLDVGQAAAWLQRAVEASGEPDAYYGLAQLVLEMHGRLLEMSAPGGGPNADADADGTDVIAAQVVQAAEAAAALAADGAGAGAGAGAGMGARTARLGVRWPLRLALSLFEAAAARRHEFAMYNLGIAHLYAYGTERDAGLAARWFEACGLPEGMYATAMARRTAGRDAEAEAWEARARRLGFGTPWRKAARLTTGTGGGGVGGVDLHSAWPGMGHPDGPPDW